VDTLARVEQWLTMMVPAGSVRVHVRRCPGERPVVLLHGFCDDGTCWAPVAVALAGDGWDVVLPDARGHGHTAMPAGEPFTHEAHVADAVAVVAGLDNPVVLVGHSLGANTAAGVAAARPDLVRRLVLEDPPWAPPGDPAADAAADAANPYEDWLRGLQAIDESARAAAAAVEHPRWSADNLAAWAASKGRVDPRLFAAEQRFLRRSWPAVARRVQSPTLMFTGETDLGAALDPETARVLSGLGWRVLRVPGTGHHVRRDDRNTYLSELRAFLSGASDATPATPDRGGFRRWPPEEAAL